MSILSIPVTYDPVFDQPTPGDGRGGLAYYMSLCGNEISNPARVRSYVAKGYAGRWVAQGDVCSALYRVGGDPQTFGNVLQDPAPWYDPTRPESADFMGFIITGINVGTIPARTISRYADTYGGAYVGPPRYTERTFEVGGYLIAASYQGREYGKRWLTTALHLGQTDPCLPCQMDFRLACPPDDGSNDDAGAWSAFGVALTDGVDYTNTDCFESTLVSFVMTAGNPYLFKPIKDCANPQVLQTDPDPGGDSCMPFCDWWAGPPTDAICCTISAPFSGILGTIVTINAPTTVRGISIGLYDTCPPDLGVDEPLGTIEIGDLRGKLVIDSSLHTVTYTDPQGNVGDGGAFIDSDVYPLPWAEVGPEDAARCVCVSALAPCSQGYDSAVTIQTRLREL